VIPPLVAFIATADPKRDPSRLEQALAQLRGAGPDPHRGAIPSPLWGEGQGEGSPVPDLASNMEHLPPLRPTKLVPDAPAAGPVSQLLDELTAQQLVPVYKSHQR
jgi:hypothetical protein